MPITHRQAHVDLDMTILTAEDLGRIRTELGDMRYEIRRLVATTSAPKTLDLAPPVRNAAYYYSVVAEIGTLLGPEAYIAYDGKQQENVCCAKVPELVGKRLKRLEYLEAREEILDQLVSALLNKEQGNETIGPKPFGGGGPFGPVTKS